MSANKTFMVSGALLLSVTMWKINAAPVYEVSEVGVIDSGTTSLALKDSSGEVFWSSTTTDQIHKMSADGIINTFAGGGVKDHFDSIFSGAGGPATSASLPNLLVIAGDNSNNIMICADGQVMYIDGTTNVIDLVGGRMIDGARGNADDDIAFQSSGDSVPAYDATF
eukprot:gene35367-43609_t